MSARCLLSSSSAASNHFLSLHLIERSRMVPWTYVRIDFDPLPRTTHDINSYEYNTTSVLEHLSSTSLFLN
jgi:hypothetical protein